MRWLKKCCWCISLRTGSVLAGAWTLFTATLMISLQVINVMSMKNLTRYQIKHGVIEVKNEKILASLEIAFGIAFAVVSLLLSIAVIKELRRKFLLPYVVAGLLYEVFDFCSLMFYLGKGIKVSPSVWIPDTVLLCINIYCILVVLSLYKEMGRMVGWTPIQEMDSGRVLIGEW